MANGNPFSPRFGAVPPVLGDRREVLAELAQVAEGNLTAEKRFLVCMLGDPHDSGIADLARRGVESEAATGLRKRLIDKGLIACSGPGRVAFTHTEARRYARMQSEAEGWRLATDGCPVEPTEAA
ncbi:MAG: hypothetical protein OXG55_16660 [bacterium]|nr:hypothetical protein [bacterium]